MFAFVGTQPFEPFGAKGTRNPRSQLTAPVLVKPSEVIRMSMGLRIVVHVCRRTTGKGRKNPRQNPLGDRKAPAACLCLLARGTSLSRRRWKRTGTPTHPRGAPTRLQASLEA